MASFAGVMLSIAGQSFHVIGQGVSLISGIYLGEIFFKSARGTIEALPRIIHRVDTEAAQAGEAGEAGGEVKALDNLRAIRDNVLTEGWKVIKLAGLIGAGISVKALGTWVQSDGVVDFFLRATGEAA